jgi:hypothetical protein
MISALSLVVSALQLVFSIFERDRGYSHSLFYIGRLMYPIYQLLYFIVCMVFATKACNLIDEDILVKEAKLCEQSKILLYKMQRIIK